MTTNTVFQLRRNTVSGTRPTTTTVAPGELAINTTDGILFSANSSTIFEIGANNTTIAVGNSTARQIANSTGVFVNGGITLTRNDTTLGFTTTSGASVGMRQQSDDNFVFYTTNTTGGSRAVFNVFANTNAPNQNSALRFNGPVDMGSSGFYANNSLGTAGQVLTSNGTSVYWAAAGAGVNTAAQFTWTNTHIFNANVTVNSTFVVANSTANVATFTSGGDLVIGATAATAKLDVVGTANIRVFETLATDNISDQSLDSNYFDVNISGSDTLTVSRSHNGVRIDVDSTATSGNTSVEHIVRGVYTTVDVTGPSNDIVGNYNDVRANTSAGTVTNLYGAQNLVEVDPVAGGTISNAIGSLNSAYAGGNGTITTIYGSRSEAVIEVGATAGVSAAYGAFNEVEIDGNSLTNGYATRSAMNIDGGVTTNGFLYYGDYQGANSTNVLNAWGLYLVGASKNYISGDVGINNTAPNATLAITGTANVSGNVVIGGSLNAANVTATVFTGALTGTASNATNLNSQPGSFYTNATNITTGTLPWAQAPSGTVNTSGAFTITGIHTHTANIVMGNTTVNTQHSNATILISNSTSTTTLGLADLRIGNTTTNVVISNTVSRFGGNVVITGTANVTGTLTGQGSVTFSTGSGSIEIGTLQGSGTVTIGGVTQTGTIQIGRSTTNQTVSIANGVTTSGNTKIVNIGTGGAAGSNTTINIGSSAGSGRVAINQTVDVTGNVNITNTLSAGNSTVNVSANSTTLIFNSTTAQAIGIFKPSANGSRYDFIAGSNNASTPFWNGLQIGAPGTFTNSTSGTTFPRTSHFYSFTNTTNPSDLFYNITAGNDSGIGTGIKLYSSSISGTQSGIDIDANGNVGIGNTAPNARLAVTGTANISGNVVIGGSLTSANLTTTTNTAAVGTAAYFVANGNLGIGTTTPASKLHVIAPNDTITLESTATTDRTTIKYLTNGNDWELGARGSAGNPNNVFYLYDVASASYRMVVNPAGNTGIGNTAPTAKLHVQGTILASDNITAFSDIRLKDDVVTIPHALDKVNKLRGVEYTSKESGNRGIGLVAQEVQTAVPEVVQQNGEYLSVAYGNMVGLLVEAIKEQQKQIDFLMSRLEN
jgi:hypothetical protein